MLQWHYITFILICFLYFILRASCVSAVNKATTTYRQLPGLDYDMWNAQMKKLWDSCMHKSPFYKKPEEWSNDKAEKKDMAFSVLLDHMERLDAYHERLYQQEILRNTDVFIIAPLLVLPQSHLQFSHSTLNPQLYHDENYNIVFKMGSQYPVDKPFLTIYLASCAKTRRPAKNLLPIQSFFYDKYMQRLVPTPVDPIEDQVEYDIALEKRKFHLYRTQDDAYYFKWKVPDIAYSGEQYCFVFDMSSVNPATVKKSKYHNLHSMKPQSWKRFLHRKWHYHQIKVSPKFEISPQPQLFSPEWFSRQYGGQDLKRFIGGDLYSFRYFDDLYRSGSIDDVWNSDEFNRHVDMRSDATAKWFGAVIDDTTQRFKNGILHTTEKYNSGFAEAEDRRYSRMRAIGLLYHPQGRRSLLAIGKALVDVSNEYQSANGLAGNLVDLVNKVKRKFKSIWKDQLVDFNQARSGLRKWVNSLKRMCNGATPTEEVLKEADKKLQSITGGTSKLPISGDKAYSAAEIKFNIMKHMNILVENEIRLIIWKMGDQLLERNDHDSKVFETMTSLSFYNYPKYFVYAAVLKTYGTKFEWMAKNFSLYGDSDVVDDEDDSDDTNNVTIS